MKNKVNFEIIFVDDGSKDDTLEVAKKLNKIDKKVKTTKMFKRLQYYKTSDFLVFK